tara:strand:+ start:246 stop:455 length:210 start_codon:yes stop_codon:yes gene_type:complete
MNFDEMGIGEILELAEDLGWKGCFDLLGNEDEDPDELERRAMDYIKTMMQVKNITIKTEPTLKETLTND